jgi:glycine betaine/proline transport system substrate-binding protein
MRIRGVVRDWGRAWASVALLIALVLAGTPATAADAWPPPLGKEKIVYTHAAWDTSTSVSNIGKILLEQLGYKVELKLVDTGLAYTALAGGTGDLWSSAWLPGQQSYLNKHGDKLDLLAIAYLPTPGGLVVPAYSPVRSIEDLKKPDVKAKLGGKIVGIDAGSGIMMTTAKVIKEYGLDYELVTGSGAAMEAAFKAAVTKNEWVVVTGWCPTAMCARYDVRFLADPKGVFSEYRNFHVARRGFRTDHPRATAFLSRFTLHVDQLSKLILVMNEEKLKPEVVAKQFIERNPELVYYWVGDLIPGHAKPASLQQQ